MEGLGGEKDLFFKIDGIPGPLGLLRGKGSPEQVALAATILARYSKAKNKNQADILYGPKDNPFCYRLTVSPAREEDTASLRF